MKNSSGTMKIFRTLFCLVVMMNCGFVTSHFTKEEDIQMLAPPERPRIIATSDDLRRYIQQLNQFYLILSRPRYGRSVAKRIPKNHLQSISAMSN